ncbi:MAG: hypothetical protein RBR86_00830 [Pseudobdellovibrionaceae bacterium]|jgi:cell division transport system permease protein|nr:hypothetical protein [Pseudobdellovibrionaceae bacterium]
MSKIFQLFPNQVVGNDVPLHLKLGTEFLVLLVTLMAFLSVLAAAGIIGLGHMTRAWTSGLENSVTIEIPPPNEGQKNISGLIKSLEKIDGVTKVERLGQKKMQEMLEPWLGGVSGIWEDLPIPALVTVTLDQRSDKNVGEIRALTRKLVPDATVDAHEEWLSDLLKLVSSLRLVALVIFCLMMTVTAAVVGGAVRSRMAIHHRELELLHIMGASDSYITMQFVRYILVQSIKGVGLGMGMGIITLGILSILSQNTSGTLPKLDFQATELLVFACVPLLLIGIAVWAARITALRVLREMP